MKYSKEDINKLAEETFGFTFRTVSQREGFVEGFTKAMEILNNSEQNQFNKQKEQMFYSYKKGFNDAVDSLKAANDLIQKKTINNEF